MRKISTLFVIIYGEKGSKGNITTDVRQENEWVYSEDGVIATQKFDGTACLIKNGQIYKRYDAKHGKQAPLGAIPCQEPDTITGHHPHWVKCSLSDSNDKHFFEALNSCDAFLEDGTYELCGEKIGINAENIKGHKLLKHGSVILDLPSFSFEDIKQFLLDNDIEGVVFYGQNEKMCKIRKTDFGFKRVGNNE